MDILSLDRTLENARILPVLTVNSADVVVDLCQALHRGGIGTVEITLRTSAGLQAIYQVKQQLPQLIVAAGTVTTREDMARSQEAGADFAVSPGMTESLIDAAARLALPLLPGVATPSEVLRGRELGLTLFKLFPAVAIGGINLLKSMAATLPDIRFCPTGGLNIHNFLDYLALSNVTCVGGSWLCPPDKIAARDWQGIEQITHRTLARL